MKLYNSIGPNPRVVRMFLAEKGIDIRKVEVVGTQVESGVPVDPTGRSRLRIPKCGSSCGKIHAEQPAIDELEIELPAADLRTIQQQIGAMAAANQHARLRELEQFSRPRCAGIDENANGPAAASRLKEPFRRCVAHDAVVPLRVKKLALELYQTVPAAAGEMLTL